MLNNNGTENESDKLYFAVVDLFCISLLHLNKTRLRKSLGDLSDNSLLDKRKNPAHNFFVFPLLISMADLDAVIAARIKQHEEKMQRHRQIVDEQRRWLLQRAHELPVHQPQAQSITQVPSSTAHSAFADHSHTTDLAHGHPAANTTLSSAAQNKNALSENVVDRLMKYGNDLRRRKEAEQFRMEEARKAQDETACKPVAPTRSTLSATRPRSASPTVSRRRHDIQLEDQYSGKPQISLRSEVLAKQRRVRESTENLPVEDALLRRAEKVDEEKWHRMQQQEAVQNPGRPQVTEKAAALRREGDVSTRLYESRASHASSLNVSELRNLVSEIVDEETISARPTITPLAQALGRREGHTAHDDLYEHAEVRRQYLAAQALKSSAELRSKPSINPVSDIIAASLQQSSFERLTKPKSQPPSPAPATFKPKLSQRSAQLSKHRPTVGSRTEELYQDAYRRNAAREKIERDREVEEASSLSFTPTTNVNHSANSSFSQESFQERSKRWDQRRQLRQEEGLRKLVEDEMKECTFAPVIASGPPPSHLKGAGTSLYDGEKEEDPATRLYLERQEYARQLKEQNRRAEEKLLSVGSKWQNRITVPNPPNLHCFEESPRPPYRHATSLAVQEAMAAIRFADEASVF